jgi:putative tributyrin esterase
MSLCHVNWFSRVIEKMVTLYAIVPDEGDGPFPVFYLLHGLSDDASGWVRRTRIELYAAKYPMIVVMPDGFRSFYTRNEQGPDYARYMAEELPAFVERLFPARKGGREARCVGGLSMGGYGALRLGLGYPDRYASIVSHSGALLYGSRAWDKSKNPEFVRVLGENPEGTDHDLRALARRAQQQCELPKIRIDCGTEDFSTACASPTNTKNSRGLTTGTTGTNTSNPPSPSMLARSG